VLVPASIISTRAIVAVELPTLKKLRSSNPRLEGTVTSYEIQLLSAVERRHAPVAVGNAVYVRVAAEFPKPRALVASTGAGGPGGVL
jgi:hypothetical protein